MNGIVEKAVNLENGVSESKMRSKKEKIEVFNINNPGKSSFVQKDKYEEVKRGFKEYMPNKSPGMNQDEMARLVIEKVSDTVFDDKTKAGWWMKTVQLDLEARRVMFREKTKPIRWYYETQGKEIIPEVTKSDEVKRKKILELPSKFKNILIMENLIEAYENRPFYQRNDYIHWITNAKREETKNKRLLQMIEELRDGKLYMKMEYNR